MTAMNDNDLLSEYARNGSDTAFAALVERHAGLVYSAALRQLQDDQLAEDVAQAVFVVLAKNAKKLSCHTSLTGWLLQTSRYAANAHIRSAIRRQRREQEAVMQSALDDSSPAIWSKLEPLLDEAMAALGETDRTILAMRYFENRTMAEISQTIKLNEEAAHKRTARAMEKLRKYFTKKGVVLSAAAIATAVSANAVQAAPAGLAAKVSGIAATGATTSTAITTLVKGTLKTMVWAKAKMAVAVTAGVLFITGTAILVSSLHNDPPANSLVARQILQGAFGRISAPLPSQMRFVVELEEVPKPVSEEKSRAEAKRIQDGVIKHESTVRGLRPEDLAKLPPEVRAERERKQAETLEIQTEFVRWAHQPRTYREQEWFSSGQWRLDQTETTLKSEKLLKFYQPLTNGIAYERTYFMLAGTNATYQRSLQIDHRLRSAWYINSGWSQPRCWQAGTLEPMISFMLTITLSDLSDVLKLAKTKSKSEKDMDSFAGMMLQPAKLDSLVNGESRLWKIKTDKVTENGRNLAVLRLKSKMSSLFSGAGMLLYGAELDFYADATNLSNIYRIEVKGSPLLLPKQSIPYISIRDDFDTNGFPHTWSVETPNDPHTKKKTIKFKEIDLPAKFDGQAVFTPEIPKDYKFNGRISR